MATCATYTKKAAVDDVEETSERLKETLKFSEDDSETQITICTWNINGSANARLRKKVTTATFNHQYEDGTRLGQSDIICVQEMTTKPERSTTHPERFTTQEYLPFARDGKYCVVQSKEPDGNIYNAVYFNKEKFSRVNDDYLTPAYDLMNIKKRCYDYIERGGDEAKKKATKGELDYPQNADEWAIFEEVLRECRKAPGGFDEMILKFRAPRETETKHPFDLLKRRMAICVLKLKSLPEHNIIVAASVHNYNSRSSGEGSPENYASLLFDFLSKLPRNVIVIIAGDFNFNIHACEDQSLTQYFPSYHIPRYKLRPLRQGLPTIDFIMVTESEADAEIQVSVIEVQAHDLQVTREVDKEIKKNCEITNHSPVSAVIELNFIEQEATCCLR